ncbi:MAG: DUF3616 domain-containing protein [Gammaproteobacteria bacterium]|nr:DUF3616 domain-containing protein [Gammaproteobacteria bacterium]
MASRPPPAFHPLTGIYEPSAIQQLADGRFLVVEDEKQHPFSLVSINSAGEISSTPLEQNSNNETESFRKLNDLEGLTADHAGYVYAITSHSRDSDGEEKKSREKLLRFRIADNTLVEPQVCHEIKSAMASAHPELAAAASQRNSKSDDGLNIEAMEISADHKSLLIGFRSPLLDDCAVIATVENPTQIFEYNASPVISSTLYQLDLGGNGLRGMAYIAALSGYLIIAGPADRTPMKFQLWFWNGQRNASPRRVRVPGIQDFERAEGVCAVVLNGRQKIMIVSDDGNRRENRYGHFVLLDTDELELE